MNFTKESCPFCLVILLATCLSACGPQFSSEGKEFLQDSRSKYGCYSIDIGTGWSKYEHECNSLIIRMVACQNTFKYDQEGLGYDTNALTQLASTMYLECTDVSEFTCVELQIRPSNESVHSDELFYGVQDDGTLNFLFAQSWGD